MMTTERILRRVLILFTMVGFALILLSCSSDGTGGGTGTRSITWELSGTYNNDPNDTEFSLQYSWVDTDGSSQIGTVFEDSISVPWQEQKTLETGTGISINLVGQDGLDSSTNLTLTIYENGTIAEQHNINNAVSPAQIEPSTSLTHVVGY